MDETKIIHVDGCTNNSCSFCIGRQCITQPEMVLATNECLSNSDETWRYFIRPGFIVNEDEEEIDDETLN